MQIQSGIGLDKPHSRRAHESHDVLLGPTLCAMTGEHETHRLAAQGSIAPLHAGFTRWRELLQRRSLYSRLTPARLLHVFRPFRCESPLPCAVSP
jgi:hypothetical protein